ncbi:MAG: dTDP-4-dehydrorhamnose 3,5-epimerase family protein [Candidatus Kerfeldbacteria bacterium]|nr:dTDP-4-dehydrorhamnose 3,5-epimerase family protein [Candidatus Kerfeldbacteria bacterium]
MIDGVRIKELKVWPDRVDPGERVTTPGFLMEVLRADEGLLQRFGQSTMTLTYPGTVKAFHWHRHQDDLWFVATGKARIVLHDLREDSPTHGQTQTILAGEGNYNLVVIPVGVAHGYKVIGDQPVVLIYYTTEPYDRLRPDEERMPADDPAIGFDWDRAS